MKRFDCYPDEALNGTKGLPDDLFKVYVRIWWEMYATGGPIRFDDRKLKHLVEKRPQDVRRLVGKLIDLGKLTVDENGYLHNGRTDKEIEKFGKMAAKWRPNGASFERHNSEKLNDSTHARAPASRSPLSKKIKDSSLRSESSAPTEKTMFTPKQELEAVLDTVHAAAVIEHRQRIRKPLTAHAAHLLAAKFAATANPNASADAMIANGWQGFEAKWLTNRKHDPPRKRNFVDAALDRINGHDDTAGLFDALGNAERLPDGEQRPGFAVEDLRGNARRDRGPGHR